MSKDNVKKTRCPKNEAIRVPARVVAQVVGCSASTVKAIRQDERSDDTELGRRIRIAEDLLTDGSNLLLKEVKRIVKVK